MSRLVIWAASLHDRPTRAQVDEMLAALRLMRRDQEVRNLIDELLDYRLQLPD
ncbi:hypothetical protein OHA25_36260 [Nonomuraea sp. NBC_00507]|uniref:hypothetical protein n=1 Tax=Nonomuraea sp. NBC_00507 TaxID=2976002 RepID=UPI002E18F0BC